MNSIAGILANSIRRKRLFLDCDDHESASSHYSGAWQKNLVSFFEDKVPLHTDHITTHNSYLQERLLALGVPADKITYIPNGVDLHRFTPKPDEDRINKLRTDLGLQGKQVIAFIGSLSLLSHPVNILVEAFQIIHRKNPNTRLLIVGGGDAYGQIVKQVAEKSLEDVVRFCGRIPSMDVPVYYRLADVVVDPVYNDDTARSRVPLKLFESWISEVPFVSGDVGDRRLLLGTPPAGILAGPGDSSSLAACILQVLENPQTAADLKQRGLERAQNYTWSHLASKLEAVYQKSLEG
jgi:glycosyltransferase involved in cell wall biosynthesis